MSRVIKYAVLAVMLAASVLVAGSKASEEVDIDFITMSELSMIENLEEGDCVTIKIEKHSDGVVRTIIVNNDEVYHLDDKQSLDEYVRSHPELDDCLENFELYSSEPIE